MPDRLRKFIGMILLVTLVVVYAVLAVVVAEARLKDYGAAIHFAYFLFTGLLWVLPGMLIIKWMAGKPKPREE